MLKYFFIPGTILALLALPSSARGQTDHSEHMQRHSGDEQAKEKGSREMMSGMHGGDIAMTEGHRFETLFTGDVVRLYVYDEEGEAVFEPEDAAVTVMIESGKSEPVTLDLTYVGPDAEMHRTQGYFAAPHGLETIDPEVMEAGFTVVALTEEPVVFQAPVREATAAVYMCPMKCKNIMAADPGTCPVCGMDFQRQQETPGGKKQDDGHSGHGHDHR